MANDDTPRRRPHRDFDLSKAPRRQFDLTKESDEAPQDAQQPAGQPSARGNAATRWIVWLVALACAGLLIWWALAPSPQPDQPAAEQFNRADREALAAEQEAQAVENGQASEAEAQEVAQAIEQAEAETPAEPAASVEPAPAAKATATAPTGDTESEARNVIRGRYGNNPDRRAALGDRYAEIQSRVNQLMRQ